MEIKILKSKKGGEKVFSIWWFFVLVIVGLGIVSGVIIFFSSAVDIREAEAEILSDKIAECIVKQRVLTDISLEEGFNILEECDFSEDVFSRGSKFYFNISFLDENGNHLRDDLLEGDFSYAKDCEIQEGENNKIKAKHFPKCVKKEEHIFYYENNVLRRATLEILAASNQRGRTLSIGE